MYDWATLVVAGYSVSYTHLDVYKRQIEDFIRDEVLPRYANTHTESSGTGLQTTRLLSLIHI